jgi:small GTP-binding protein
MQIWDTAGQEKYRALAPMYYRSADIALLVYDVTQRESFDALAQWCDELAEKGPSNLQLIVVGNKIDLKSDRVIQSDAGQAFAGLHNARYYQEVSAKTGDGIIELFEKAADLVTQSRTAGPDIKTEKSALVAKTESNGCC